MNSLKTIIALVVTIAIWLSLPTPARAAIASAGTLGAISSKTANQSSLVLTTSATAEANNVIIVTIARDNAGTADASGYSNDIASVVDSASNTYTEAYSYTNGQGSAQAGAFVSVWYSKLSSQLNSGGTITVNFNNTTLADATAMSAWEYTVGAGNTISVQTQTQSAVDGGDPGSTALSGLDNQEWLFFKGIAAETDNSTLTNTTNFTLISGANTTGNPEAGNMSVTGEFRIVTATSSTSDPGLGDATNDNISVFIAFKEVTLVTLSGTIYQTNESSAYLCSTDGNRTVNLRVNGAGSYSTTCTADTGAWSISNVGLSSGQTVYVYISGGSVRGSTVLISDGTAKSDIPIYQDRVALRDDVNGSITNTEISTGNTADADDLISFSGSDITVASTYETHIYTADTYAPGANVSTGKLHVVGSYSGSTETLTLTGSGTSTSRPLYVNGGTFTAPTTTVFQGTSATDIEATTFNALTLNPTLTGSISYTFLGAETINGNFTIQPDAASALVLTVNLGGTTTVGASNTTTITRTGSNATSNLDTVSGQNHALSTGLLDIATGGTLTANNSTITITGTSGTLFTRAGTFTQGGSTVIFNGDGSPTALTSNNAISFNNLSLTPSISSSGRNYDFGTVVLTIVGNFTIQPSGTQLLTVNMGADIVVDPTKTTTITRSGSATSVLDTRPIATSHNLSTGFLNIAAGGTLDAGSSTSGISLSGTSGTLLTYGGTFTTGTSTITVTSASGSPTLFSTTVPVHHLSVNSTATVINLGAATTLNSAGNLNITQGILDDGANQITCTATCTGTLTLASGAELRLGNSTTATVFPANYTTFSINSASTVTYQANAAQTISRTPTYGNLKLAPTLSGSGKTYTFANGTVTVDGDFTVNPTASTSLALTVNMDGAITVAAGKTTTLTGTTSGTSILDTISGQNHGLSTGLLNIATAGTLTANNSTITLTGTSGTLFTRVGTFSSGNSTVSVTSASGSPTLNSGTISFYALTINPGSITITTSADDLTVTNTLNVAVNDTLSLASGQDLTHSGATLTLDGTISGSGTLIYQSATAFPTSGTISSILRMDATNNDQTMGGTRTYGGNVEIYNNSGASARNVVLGSAGGQTLTFSGNITLNAANTQSVTLTASANTPTVDITGNLVGTSGGGSENLTLGATTWTVSGDVNFTNINALTVTGSTFRMNGSSKTITSNSKSLNNFAVTGGSVSNVDNLDVNGTFSVSSGTFTHGAGANIDIFVAGNFTLSSGITWTENVTPTSQLIFDGNMTYTDSTAVKQSVGNVQIGNSPGVTNLASDFSANSLTIVAGDVFNACEYDVDIGNGGITLNTGSPGGTLDASATGTTVSCSANEGDETTINDANVFTINSGAVFVQDASTVIMDDNDGTNAITSSSRSFYNLTIDDANNDATIIILLEDALDVDNNLNIADGTLDVNSSEHNAITIGGNFTNSSTFQARNGTVTFNDASKNSTLSYTANTTFYGFNVSTGGKQMYFDDAFQTIIAAGGNFTIQGTGCTTNRVFLDSETNDNPWDLNVNASASYDIDYADIEDSNSTNAITAQNSTQINNSNTNWTISGGACAAGQNFYFDGPLQMEGLNIN